jgi:hypothetical protein
MAKFVNSVILIDDENCQSQLDYDISVLSAAIVYMADYYKRIFNGLDEVIKAINKLQSEKDKIIMKYKYKRVKIDSRQAKILQSRGYKVIHSEPFQGYVTFEIPMEKKISKIAII